MKTIKILSMAVLALVGAALTSCSKDDSSINDNPEKPTNPKNIVTLTTTISRDADDPTSRALTPAGVKTFAVGETMAVVYNNGTSTVKATSHALTAGDITNEGKSATFTFELESPNKSVDVTYIYPAAMAKDNGDINYAALNSQDGLLSTLASNLDLATYTAAWNSGNLPNCTLENQLAILAITLKNEDGSSDITSSITGMTLSDGTNSYSVSRSAAEGPIYIAIHPANNANISIEAFDGSDLYKYTKSLTEKTYDANNGYNVSWRMTKLPTGAINSKFTINASGDQVYFSKGNLQAYNATANSTDGWTWSFAEHQYDYIGDATANISIKDSKILSTAGTVDLFGWTGSSAPKSTKDNYGIHNSGGSYPYGTTCPDVLNHDWGHNAITNGGNTADKWRTPTKDEWVWILGPASSPTPGTNCRTSSTVGGTTNARFTLATINETYKGMIIFPDSYTVGTPTGVTWGDINTYSDYTTTCTTAGWEALEVAGCVFLPAAGYRDQTTVRQSGSYGYYWSSTCYTSGSSVYRMWFDSTRFNSEAYASRCFGYSVRLVYDAE